MSFAFFGFAIGLVSWRFCSTIWQPDLDQIARRNRQHVSIASFVGGGAVVARSVSDTPISKNTCSRPAWATEINIFAGLSLSFLNECVVPTGMLANIPAVATTSSPLIVNAIIPSRT